MMTRMATRRPRSLALRRWIAGLATALLVLAPVGALLLAVESQPRVAGVAPPDAAAAWRLRGLGGRLQAFLESDGAAEGFSAREAEINAAIASLARVQPGIAGRVAVADGEIEAALSAGPPLVPAARWINVRATFGPGPEGTTLTGLRVGRLPLPPGATLAAARWGLDRYLGDGLGSALVRWVGALEIEAPVVRLAIEPGEFTGGGRLERLKARLRAMAAGAAEPARVQAYLDDIHGAARRGELADAGGSVTPLLRHTLAAAAAREVADPQAEMRAAIFALALYCGDPRFGRAIGVTVDRAMLGAGNHCAERTLHERNDLVRHFLVSAGIHAASTDRAVLGLGELKELLDSNPGGTGFGFDDMAANLAGARFAAVLMAAPQAEWATLARTVAREDAIFPPLDDLPAGIDADTFEAEFGDVDSPAYLALLGEIEARLDLVPLYAGTARSE